jgi:hypothetical protein
MNANGVVALKRRLSRAEAERLVSEFEQSGLKRKEFCATRGLNVFTLDAWRKRIAQSRTQEKIVPVEIVEDRKSGSGSVRTGSVAPRVPFGIILRGGLRIEVEPGFDAAELRRLIAALDSMQRRAGLSHAV